MPAETLAKMLALLAADDAHRGGRAVLLVVGVEDQEKVKRLDVLRVDVVLLRGVAEHHLQEVARVPEAVVGVDVRLAARALVRPGGDGGQLGEEPHRRHLDVLGFVGVEAVLVEGGQRRHRRRHDGHRVRVAGEGVEKLPEVFLQQGVTGDGRLEALELRGGGQLAVDEQVRRLEEVALRCELLDGVPPVPQDALLTVEEGDGTRGGGRVDEARVERHQPGRAAELADVNSALLLGADRDREFKRLAFVVERDVRHRASPPKIPPEQ
jgi:hypothetical protein